MAEKYCTAPNCFENDETCTMYAERSKQTGALFPVCGEHVDDSRVTKYIINDPSARLLKDGVVKVI